MKPKKTLEQKIDDLNRRMSPEQRKQLAKVARLIGNTSKVDYGNFVPPPKSPGYKLVVDEKEIKRIAREASEGLRERGVKLRRKKRP
jgi:hypothetical protein